MIVAVFRLSGLKLFFELSNAGKMGEFGEETYPPHCPGRALIIRHSSSTMNLFVCASSNYIIVGLFLHW